MKRVKEIFDGYNELSYQFLIDYLLFTNNLNEEIKQFNSIIITDKFLKYFRFKLQIISKRYYYPEETLKNIKEVLDYIEENNDNKNELDACYEALENILLFSNDKYFDEFNIKKNNLQDYKDNEYYVWKKDDIKESICFDFIVYMSLNCPFDNYVTEYLEKFILSKNYIYSIKKIIYLCPDILKIEQFRNRVQQIIKLDLELLEEYDMDTIGEYIKHNYRLDKAIDFNIQELEEFKKEIENVSFELNHINLEPFNLPEFKAYYQMLMLEQYIYFDSEIDIRNIDLDIVYKFIEENNEKSLLSKKHKLKLLDILTSRKKDSLSLIEYNSYLVKLNEIEEVDEAIIIFDESNRRSNKIDFIKSILMCFKNDISLSVEIAESKKYDLGNFESFLANDKDFDYIKEYLKETYYPISINRFIKECPSMFMDQTIYKRTMEILNDYDNNYSKKAIKKLEKMMKRL